MIRLLGVNETGHEVDNPTICAGRDLPWLQDTISVIAWSLWGVTNRDVVILDRQNMRVQVYNLTSHDLTYNDGMGNYPYYNELKAILKSAAGEP